MASRSDDWLIWQLADSAFPAGGFAHSGGLEAAWQHGEVRSRDELLGFARASLAQTARSLLPFATATHREPNRLAEADRWCDAFLSNHVANRASRLQGRGWLLAAERSFPSPALAELRSLVSERELPGHLAPVFGGVAAVLGVAVTTASRLFLFLALRGLMGSAVRLGIVGPMESQALQARLAGDAEAAARRCARFSMAEAAQTAPLLEVWQGAHDRLYSRLFQS